MKKTLLIGITTAAITLGGLGTAWAHFKDGGEKGPQMLEQVAQELKLTADQKAQIAETMKARHEARKQGGGDRREFRHELMNLDPNAKDYQKQLDELVMKAQQRAKQMVLDRAEQKEKIYAILTPEQRAEFAALKQDMRKKWHDKEDGDHGRHHGKKDCD